MITIILDQDEIAHALAAYVRQQGWKTYDAGRLIISDCPQGDIITVRYEVEVDVEVKPG